MERLGLREVLPGDLRIGGGATRSSEVSWNCDMELVLLGLTCVSLIS